MKAFVVVRDEKALRTVLCLEAKDNAEASALHDAFVRYPDPNRYSVTTLYGRDWPSVCIGYPRYADATPEPFAP